jgi:hypothetical protein
MTKTNKRAAFLKSVKNRWWSRVGFMRLVTASYSLLINDNQLPPVYTKIERLFRDCRAELDFRDDPAFAPAYRGRFKTLYKEPNHLTDLDNASDNDIQEALGYNK